MNTEKHPVWHEDNPEIDPQTGKVVTYTPGYVPHKIGMIIISAFIAYMGLSKLVPDLLLFAKGVSTKAEVIQIVRTQSGEEDVILKKDLEWKSIEESKQRAYTYWSVLSYATKTGAKYTFRSDIGTTGKPTHPLLDADGLPTVVRIVYDPASPETVILSTEHSTWFLSSLLSFFGLLGVCIGSMLLYFAKKPIPLPKVIDGSQLHNPAAH